MIPGPPFLIPGASSPHTIDFSEDKHAKLTLNLGLYCLIEKVKTRPYSSPSLLRTMIGSGGNGRLAMTIDARRGGRAEYTSGLRLLVPPHLHLPFMTRERYLFIGTHSVTLALCALTTASALWEII